ncbi:hypothetical protein MKW94_013798 [Papaver nudicaule]|uniref:RING-type E3 ubiquitin transferase n=1 Tax=Papaver nudicaule TaxID=74823 RepID=A0AA42B0A4_PAPNU|nr:hypothetical protein [Papaver nudicaule]
MEEDKGILAQKLIDIVNEISAITDYRCAIKKQYCNLSRRLKLLIPMFEELKETKEEVPEEVIKSLICLQQALESARELLKFGSEGSKIYLVLERDLIMKKFQEVTAQLEHALAGISYDELDISDEVREQVELVISQFKRAKVRLDTPDAELYEDLLGVYKQSNDGITDPDVLRRLAERLQLMGISDLTHESLALHEMVVSSGGDPEESIEKMSMLLKRIKDFIQTDNPEIDIPAIENSHLSGLGEQVPGNDSPKSITIPDDFRCPISLELMKDPVIVSTGQTYERQCIEKWIDAGHGTCPKTQQTLSSTALTPNYVLRSLIAQWCEANGIEAPKRPGYPRPSKTVSLCSPEECAMIDSLIRKLASSILEDQRSAAGELRLLAKRNADNQHAVTTLLNLSICEENKGSIVTSGALPGIVHVLKRGSMEARENAAATLFSLSVVDDNKVTIGGSGAIPALVILLSEGSQRGKKDAATALFNLCIYQGNKGRAVRAGLVPTLMKLLTEPEAAMVDEVLAILAILSSHSEGKAAIGAAEAVPVLVDVIGNGSPRNKENAAAVLVHLSSGDQQKYLAQMQELGIMEPLLDLVQNGTDRGKRKAGQLLERMNRFVEHQKQQLQAQKQSEPPELQPLSSTSHSDS